MTRSIPLSIIVPTLDEGAVIVRLLRALQPLRAQQCELIVVDGGSSDRTCEQARPLADSLLCGPAGRARQMNQGAGVARGEWLWFLHADTGLTQEPEAYLAAICGCRRDWGHFDVHLDAPDLVFRVIEWLMNKRSRLSGIATGDQGLFVRRHRFAAIGGYADIPLMEDIEICRCLGRAQRPLASRLQLSTSARRWQRHGVGRTVLLMWRLRLGYFMGVDPYRLARVYRKCSSPTRGY